MTRSIWLIVLACIACGPESGTGGRSIVFTTEVVADPAPGETSPATFTTPDGYRVTLTRAQLVVGPLYLFENPPQFAWRPRRGFWDAIADMVVPAAHAHPGDAFFSGGRALGEWTDQFVVDALTSTPLTLGASVGIAGTARSFSLVYFPPGELAESSVRIAGVAAKDGMELHFTAAVSYPGPIADQRVDFVAVEASLDEGGVFTLHVKPYRWLDGALFDRVAAPADDPHVALGTDHQPYRALLVNLRRQTAFAGSWRDHANP